MKVDTFRIVRANKLRTQQHILYENLVGGKVMATTLRKLLRKNLGNNSLIVEAKALVFKRRKIKFLPIGYMTVQEEWKKVFEVYDK